MHFSKIGIICILITSITCVKKSEHDNNMKNYFKNNSFIECLYTNRINHFSNDSCNIILIEFNSPIPLYTSRSYTGIAISYVLKSIDSVYILDTEFSENTFVDIMEVLSSVQGVVPKMNLVKSDSKTLLLMNNDMPELPYYYYCYSDVFNYKKYSDDNEYRKRKLAMSKIFIFPFLDDRFEISFAINNVLQNNANRDQIHDSLVKCILETCRFQFYLSK